MPEGQDLFRIQQEVITFEGRQVHGEHAVIPDPKPRPTNPEGTQEDYFIFKENGQTVLLKLSPRHPPKWTRVDLATSEGVGTWNYVKSLKAF